jgi:hypothetical protein
MPGCDLDVAMNGKVGINSVYAYPSGMIMVLVGEVVKFGPFLFLYFIVSMGP